VTTAVSSLPPLPNSLNPNPITNPYTTQDPTGIFFDLHMATAHWVDTLNGYPSAPQQLLHAIEHVKKLAWDLYQQPAPGPEHELFKLKTT